MDAIPYFSQWDEDGNQRSADCGQTCVKMLAASCDIDVQINALTFQTRADGSASGNDLIKNFNMIGLKATEHINEPLRMGDICLVEYGLLSDRQNWEYIKLHWMVYLSRGNKYVTVHDPNFYEARRLEGARKRYPNAEWDLAYKGRFVRMTEPVLS